jgi:serine/threonine protein kinase
MSGRRVLTPLHSDQLRICEGDLFPSSRYPYSCYRALSAAGAGGGGAVVSAVLQPADDAAGGGHPPRIAEWGRIFALKAVRSSPLFAIQGAMEVHLLHTLDRERERALAAERAARAGGAHGGAPAGGGGPLNGVVRMVEHFSCRGHLCIVQEFLPCSLLDVLSANSFAGLPLRAIAGILRQLCATVHALHALGLVHADVKPENVMLFGSGADALLGRVPSTDDGGGGGSACEAAGAVEKASPPRAAHGGCGGGAAPSHAHSSVEDFPKKRELRAHTSATLPASPWRPPVSPVPEEPPMEEAPRPWDVGEPSYLFRPAAEAELPPVYDPALPPPQDAPPVTRYDPALPVHLRLIDFGSAGFENSCATLRRGQYAQTRFYRAPEVLLGLPFSGAIDMWGVGCVGMELLLGLPLIPGCDEHDVVRRMMVLFGYPPEWMLALGASREKFFLPREGGGGPGGCAPGKAWVTLPRDWDAHGGGSGTRKHSSSMDAAWPGGRGACVSAARRAMAAARARYPPMHPPASAGAAAAATATTYERSLPYLPAPRSAWRLRSREEWAQWLSARGEGGHPAALPPSRHYVPLAPLQEVALSQRGPLLSNLTLDAQQGLVAHAGAALAALEGAGGGAAGAPLPLPAALLAAPSEERAALLLFADFTARVLCLDPFQRLTAEEALRHPFLAGEGGGGGAQRDPRALAAENAGVRARRQEALHEALGGGDCASGGLPQWAAESAERVAATVAGGALPPWAAAAVAVETAERVAAVVAGGGQPQWAAVVATPAAAAAAAGGGGGSPPPCAPPAPQRQPSLSSPQLTSPSSQQLTRIPGTVFHVTRTRATSSADGSGGGGGGGCGGGGGGAAGAALFAAYPPLPASAPSTPRPAPLRAPVLELPGALPPGLAIAPFQLTSSSARVSPGGNNMPPSPLSSPRNRSGSGFR